VGAEPPGADKSILEMYDGTSWSRVDLLVPGHDGLSGVSCTSPTFCIAVGFLLRESPGRTLVEKWDGVKWSRVASPNRRSHDSRLSGVSCVSPTSCVAVGQYSRGLLHKTLTETWDGASWSIAPSPSPTGKDNYLRSVSCVSPTACFAVGQSQKTTSDSRQLIESFDGTNWSIVPSPYRSQYSFLDSVSCASPANCIAVGAAEAPGFGSSTTLVMTWDGVSWSRSTARNPGGNHNFLFGVTCTSSTNCLAVGTYSTGAHNRFRLLIETWNGSTWSTTPGPHVAGRDELLAVSCAAKNTCAAVGWSATLGALVLSGT
jgi:hypothetical protein